MWFSRRLELFILIYWIHLTGILVQGVEFKYYDNGTLFVTETKSLQNSYTEFGPFSHWCAGSLSACVNGFSVEFTMKPLTRNVEDKATIILSNGAHLPYSDGFQVVRSFGDQYDFSVAKADKEQRVSFHIMPDDFVYINIIWEDNLGLSVYVDTYLVGMDTEWKPRQYSAEAFDPCTSIIVGLNMDFTPQTDVKVMELKDIIFRDKVINVQDHVEDKLSDMVLGCVDGIDISNLDKRDLPSSADVNRCRDICFERNSSIALLKDLVTCACTTKKFLDDYSVDETCATASEWYCYVVNHLKRDVDFTITLQKQPLTDQDFIAPYVTVLFTFTPNVPLDLEYEITFGDGSKVYTSDTSNGHYWVAPGSYSVIVSASVGILRLKATETVLIENKEGGKPPQKIFIDVCQFIVSNEMRLNLVSVDAEWTTCSLDPGDGRAMINFNGTTFLDAIEFTHKYKAFGQYGVSVECSNAYGNITNTTTLVAADFEVPKFKLNLGDPFQVPVTGGEDFLKSITATVNGKAANVQLTQDGSAIIISGDSFVYPFDNIVEISHEGRVIKTIIVDTQSDAPDINVICTPPMVSEPGPIDVSIVVAPGDHLHLVVDYGQGIFDYIYVNEVTDEVKIDRSVHYSDFKDYNIKVQVGNDVSNKSVVHVVSVIQKIEYVDITASLPRVVTGEDARFLLTISNGTGITFKIDFGDGTKFTFCQNDLNPLADSDDKLSNAIAQGIDNGRAFISVTHTYKSTGHFSVKVEATNSFSSYQSELCQNIVAAPRSGCTINIPTVDDISSPNEPLRITDTDANEPHIKTRSSTIIFKAEAQATCSNSSTILYSWRAIRYFGENGASDITRPESSICLFQRTKNSLTIQPLQLEFGLYQVTVSASVKDDDMAFAEFSFYLKIGSSNPISVISGSEEETYIIWQTLVFDLSESKDPDLKENVREGLEYEVFCMPEAQKSEAEMLETDALRSGSTEIVTGNFYRSTTNNPVKLYEYERCFRSAQNVTDDLILVEGKLKISGNVFRTDKLSFYIIACVTKEDRSGCSSQLIQMKMSNTSGDMSMLDLIFLSGDVGALANAVKDLAEGMDSEGNGTDAANVEENAEKRSKMLNYIDKAADNADSVQVVSSCMSAITSVTKKASEVTDDSRATASNSIASLANKTNELDDATESSLTEAAEGLTSAVGNILPITEEQAQKEIATARRKKRSLRESRNAEPDSETKVPDEPEMDDYHHLLNKHFVPDGPEPHELYKYVFFRWWLFKKSLKGLDVTGMLPLEPKAGEDYQEQTWACIVTGEEPGDLEDFYLVPLRRKKAESDAAKLEADKKVVGKSMSAVNDIGNNLMGKKEDTNPVQMSSPRLTVGLQKVNPNATDGQNQAMESDSGGFQMPQTVLSGVSDDNSSIGTQFVAMANNPFTWGAEKTETPVISLKYTHPNGTEIKVSDSAEPVILKMNTRNEASILPPPSEFSIVAEHGKKEQTFNIHPLNVTDPNSTIMIYLWPNGTDRIFEIIVAYGAHPNMSFYNFSAVTSDYKEFPDVLESDVRDHLEHCTVVNSSTTQMNGTYYIGVRIKSAPVEVGKEFSLHGYKIRLFTTKCKYWDEEKQAWDGQGCELTNMTTVFSTECSCTHLTSFGGGFAVPPNTIDFSNVWAKFGNLSENASVFSTVISMIGVYIILLIWARRQDKRDVLKWGATPLEDNLPADNYHYQLSVYTGVKKNAGTSSRIHFILSGDNSDTGARLLYDGKRKHFKTGSIMNFIMSVDSCLGPMTFLRIWHDNSGNGKNKSWYLDQIQLTDLQTGDKFFFLNDRWLAVEEDDGQVDRIIPVAGIEDLIAFKTLFSSGMRKKLSNDHLWVSIFSRPTRSSFTRMQRVSCCVSLLFLTMITNCMWFKSDENGPKTGLKLGPFQFTLQQIFISFASTMIVFPVSFFQVTLFRRCRPKNTGVMQVNQQIPKRGKKYRWKTITQSNSALWGNMEQSKMRKFQMGVKGILNFHGQDKYDDDAPEPDDNKPVKKKKGWSLPHWCLYIAWGLCFLTILTSGFFTILYSMEWGSSKSLDWLTTFLLSFFQSVVVVQPIKVLLLVAFLACIFKKPDIDGEDDTHELKNVLAPDEELVCDKQDVDINAIKLQRAMAQNSVQTADPAFLEEQKQLRLKEIKMEQVLKEIIIYVFFVLILFFLSYQQRDSSSFGVATNLKNSFAGKFDQISTVLDYWVWLESTFIPALFVQKYQDGSPVLVWWDKRCTSDLVHRRVGIGRLRQMRIKENTCKIVEELAPLINHCREAYSWTADDTKPYLPKWVEPPEENKTAMEEERDNPFVYQNSFRLKNAPYVGMIGTYKGGGYVANFERGYKRTKKMLTELKANEWLDLKTRAVFAEFTVFNPYLNLFGTVTMLVEFMNTGAAATRYEFKVFRMFSYVGAMGIVVILFEVLYGCFAIYFFVRCVKKVKKERLKYFFQFWNLLEFVMLCFCITCIVMYIFKHVLTKAAMYTLKESGAGDFVNFQSLALYDEMYGYMCAIVVFLATIQVLRFLQFNKKMNMLGDTIKLASKDLKVFSISFLLYFMTFTMTAYLLFGPILVTYSSFIGSAESLFAFSLGSFDYTAMVTAQPVLGNAFFFLFIGVIYIGMMSIFLTIICEAFSSVKENIHLRSNEYELVDFMIKKVKGILGVK